MELFWGNPEIISICREKRAEGVRAKKVMMSSVEDNSGEGD